MRKVIYSATKPTGQLTLGNYLGAIKGWTEMQENFNCIFAVADLHSLTISIEPSELRENTYQQFATFLACGIDPEKSVVYLQSSVKEHTELGWIVSCFTGFGQASRMTQFKDMKIKTPENISAGLFNYPMLMAADIFLFNTEVVPVGVDQVQHVELARDLALKINSKFGNVLTLPVPLIGKMGSKIYDLQNPEKKMSKSLGENKGVIFLSDSDEEIMKKFKKAVTDSDNKILFSENKPGVSNLLSIYSLFSKITIAEAEEHFKDKGYGHLKIETAEKVIEAIAPIRNKIESLLANKPYLDKMIELGRIKAEKIAKERLNIIKEKIGLVSI